MDSVALYQENACDSFVSIGGGSSHDACKGARARSPTTAPPGGGNVNEFEGFNMSENPKNPPHIAVSTTAGTGSETSWAYDITDHHHRPRQPSQVRRLRRRLVTLAGHRRPGALLRLPPSTTPPSAGSTCCPRLRALRLAARLSSRRWQRAARIKLTNQHLRAAVWNGQDLAGREA